MPFNPEETRQKTLAHLVMMAAHPGWKGQAWHSANVLATDWPEVFGDLPELLTQAMRERSSEEPLSSGN